MTLHNKSLPGSFAEGSPWLKSPVIQNLPCRSQILKDLSPESTVTDAVKLAFDTLLGDCPVGHPATFKSTQYILEALADAIDKSAHDHKNDPAFYPNPNTSINRTALRTVNRFELNLYLLDVFLFILFPAARINPSGYVPSARPLGLPDACPQKYTMMEKAEWMIGSLVNMDISIDKLLAQIIESDTRLSDAVATSGVPGTPQHHKSVGDVLHHAVGVHELAAKTHAYCHQFGLIAQGVWDIVTKQAGYSSRIDHAQKTLDLATGSSIVVPILRLFFNPKLAWRHQSMSVDLAVQALTQPNLHLSSPLLVNCEELLFMSVLDMIEQVHSHSSTCPVPRVHQLRQWLTPDFLGYPSTWTWPTRVPKVMNLFSVPLPEMPSFDASSSSVDSLALIQSSIPHGHLQSSSTDNATIHQPSSFLPTLDYLSQEHIQIVRLDTDMLPTLLPAAQASRPQLLLEAPPISNNLLSIPGPLVHGPVPFNILNTVPAPIVPAAIQAYPMGRTVGPNMDFPVVSPAVAEAILEALGEPLGSDEPCNPGPNQAVMQDDSIWSDLDGLLSICPRTTPALGEATLGKRTRRDSSSSADGASAGDITNKKMRTEDENGEHITIETDQRNPLGGPLPLTTAPLSQEHSAEPVSLDPPVRPFLSGKKLPPAYHKDRLLPLDEDELSNFSVDEWDLEDVGEAFEDAKPFCPVVVPHCVSVGEFQQKEVLVPQVPNQKPDMDMFMAVLDKALQDSNNFPAHAKRTLYMESSSIFEAEIDLAAEFCERNILILPSAHEILSCKRWIGKDGRINLDSIMDPSTLVQVHDLSYSDMTAGGHMDVLHQGKVSVVIDHMYNDYGRIFNILSLYDKTHSTAQHPAISKLSNQSAAFNSTASLKKKFPLFPHTFSSWHLLSGPGAVTRDHVDAAGACTWIQIDSGSKLWLTMVCSKSSAVDPLSLSGAYSDDPWGANVSNLPYLLENYHWEAHYLTAGSVFIMRPHTVHLVLTLEPTLCHGGHFYSSVTMMRTLHARRLEHFHCETLTNTSLPNSWLVLHRMLLYAHMRIVTEGGDSPYPLPDLAALLVMCKYQEAFTAQTEAQPDPYKYTLQKRLAQKAADVLQERDELADLVNDVKSGLLEWQSHLLNYTDHHGHAIPDGKTWGQLIFGVAREEELMEVDD